MKKSFLTGKPEDTKNEKITVEEYYKRLVKIYEVGEVGVWFVKAGTKKIEFSDRAREIYELDPGVTITFPKLFTIIPSDDVKRVQVVINDLVEGKVNQFAYTHGIITKSGKIKYVRAWGIKQDRDGVYEGAYGGIADITWEKTQREKGRIYGRYLELASGTGQVAFWRYDAENTRNVVTEWYKALGYHLEERNYVVPEDWSDLLHPEDKGNAIARFEAFLKSNESEYKDIYRLRKSNGEYAYIKSMGKVIEWTKEETPKVVIGTHSDITDIMQIQESLQSAELKLTFLMDNVADIVIQIDDSGKILFDSKKFKKILPGIKTENDLLFSYIYKDDRDVLISKLTEIDKHNQVVAVTCRLGNNREHIWFDWHIKGVFSESDILTSFILVGNDITDKVKTQQLMRESEVNLRMLVENVKDLIIKFNNQNRITYMADNASLILGIPVEYIKSMALDKIFFDAEADQVKEAFIKIRERLGADKNFAARVNTANGVRWYDWNGRGLNAAGDIVCVGRDVTDIINHQQKNNELAKKIDTTLDVAGIATWDWNLITDHITFSPMLFKMLNRPEEPVENHGFEMINQWIHPDDLKTILKTETPEKKEKKILIEDKFRIMKSNGDYIWFQSRGYVTEWDESGRSKRALGVYINVQKEQQLQDKLLYLAYHDELTGLLNRKKIIELIEAGISSGEVKNAAAITMDIDDFKATNDVFGHAVGDMLLVSIAQTLQARVGDMGYCARLAGDEFFIYVPNFRAKQDVIDLTSKLINFFGSALVLPNDYDIDISTSAGVVFYPDDTTDIDMLINYSDIAMLQAKEIGKNRFVLYNGEVTKQYYQSHQLLYDIRSAIKKQEFEMYYQPVVDYDNNEVVQLEALLRWQHPTYGMLTPSGFIHVAETSGEIAYIFKVLYKDILAQLKKWQRKYPKLTLSVNLSARQLTEEGFSDYLIDIAKEAQIPPNQLIFEITETTLLHVVETVRTNLKAIRSYGFKLALDDFGMEYSSLAMLEKIGFDMIKIDRFFVINFEESFVSKEIIKMIGSIIKGLKKQSIVEGIETEQQLKVMHGLGFSWMQGFYFSKPLPIQDVDKFLREFGKKAHKKRA